jgi:hypothetical protein
LNAVCCANIEEKKLSRKFQMLKIIYFGSIWPITEIRKVKAVYPSPFYDGKYHPPKMSSMAAEF